MHSVVHTYPPEITEPIFDHYQGTKQMKKSIEVIHIDLYKDQIIKNTVCNVQPSQNLTPRNFPPLTYSKGY